jgi:hypothetical protein
LLNININQELSEHTGAFLALHNVLNTSYESYDDYPMPGITVTLGLRFKAGTPGRAGGAAEYAALPGGAEEAADE